MTVLSSFVTNTFKFSVFTYHLEEALIINKISEQDSKERVLLCVNAILERKAGRLVILNVKEISPVADYFIICDGSSDRQVQAIAASVQERMKKSGILPLGVEGQSAGKWVLLDYNDIIIHIFYQPVREFYDLERLWSDVPRMEVPDEVTELDSLSDEI